MIGQYDLYLRIQQKHQESTGKTFKINATIYEPAIALCQIKAFNLSQLAGPFSSYKEVSAIPLIYIYQIGQREELVLTYDAKFKFEPEDCTNNELQFPTITITKSNNALVPANHLGLPPIFQFNPFIRTFSLNIPVVQNNNESVIAPKSNQWAGSYTLSIL